MDIADKHFKTKKSAEEYVRDMITKIGVCESVKTHNRDNYNFLIDLFSRHPKYPEKIYNMTDISIVPNKVTPRFLELNLIRHDGTTDDISWRNCISGVERNKFKCAMRVAIDEQIKLFRSTHNNECAICKTTSADEYHVDHENHFEEILYNYLKTTTKDTPTIFQNASNNMKMFMPDNKDYEDEWKLFHEANAKLRMLCSTCNLKRPKWRHIV